MKKIILVTNEISWLIKNMATKLTLKELISIRTDHSKKLKDSQFIKYSRFIKDIKKLSFKTIILQSNIRNIQSFNSFFNQFKKISKKIFNSNYIDYHFVNTGISINILRYSQKISLMN